ncbi:response regulator [Mesorhizobium sp. B1-1-8]|uniref:response regulator n=1 Tax=Mesorhizobium sp. B1-1-8 TaxID=2589976 RepID=UPI001129945C|nr:response regulator [Mesorhizobium sp. B1-1-8]UCI06311.1 response regulator [Mesorhizobium sp. B1-1-8]
MSAKSENDSKPRTILVVEDEYFIASEIALALEKRGMRVLGPVARLDDALSILADSHPSGAVLDVNLRGEMVFSLAAELEARNISFVFATGYDARAIPERFRNVPCWEKPFDSKTLAAFLSAMT